MKSLAGSKRGEGYIDICVGIVAFVMVLVIAINLFSFITLRIELDSIADELIESATQTGCFGAEFNDTVAVMKEDYYDFNVATGADRYFNVPYSRVQLGERMWVEVSVDTYIKGVGVFKIPVTLTVKKSGLSENYWK